MIVCFCCWKINISCERLKHRDPVAIWKTYETLICLFLQEWNIFSSLYSMFLERQLHNPGSLSIKNGFVWECVCILQTEMHKCILAVKDSNCIEPQ